LRVTIQQKDSRSATIKIEGKIAGTNVAELDRAWQELAPTLGEEKLTVDLCGVTFMDGKAKNLLAEIYATTQAMFIADTPLTKYFAQEAQQTIRISIGADSKFNSEIKVRR
jgi:hypothetical protein